MTLTRSDRQNLLGKITTFVAQKYYDPAFGGKDWKQIVSKHTESIVQAETADGFEAAVTDMLQEVHSSGMGLLGPTTKITPRSAINASFRRVETSADGSRWVFQDVLPGGVAARAGVQPGDALISADGNDIASAQPPAFPMGRTHSHCRLQKRRQNREAFGSGDPGPEIQGQSLFRTRQRDREDGVRLARRCEGESVSRARSASISRIMSTPFSGRRFRTSKRLVIDLRGNPGGGIGGLHLMSYLTPSKVPVGYSLDRPTAERGYDKETLPRLDHIPKSKLEIPLLAHQVLREEVRRAGNVGLGQPELPRSRGDSRQ